MFALIIKGIWHAGKGEQLKSNRLAQIRSALGVRMVHFHPFTFRLQLSLVLVSRLTLETRGEKQS